MSVFVLSVGLKSLQEFIVRLVRSLSKLMYLLDRFSGAHHSPYKIQRIKYYEKNVSVW